MWIYIIYLKYALIYSFLILLASRRLTFSVIYSLYTLPHSLSATFSRTSSFYIRAHYHSFFDVHVTVHRDKFLLINQPDALISQIYFGRKLYMFRTVPLSIIRSFSLYTQQWYMSYRFADSLRARSGWNILILLASCQQICILSIIRSYSLYTQQ